MARFSDARYPSESCQLSVGIGHPMCTDVELKASLMCMAVFGNYIKNSFTVYEGVQQYEASGELLCELSDGEFLFEAGRKCVYFGFHQGSGNATTAS